VEKNWDAIVAGAGIVGVSLALELHERGARVLLLDRGEPGREATSAAAGMLAPADPETPEALRPLAFESARIYPEFVSKLEASSGIGVDFRRQGTISFQHGSNPPPEYRKLSVEELRNLEPSIQPQPGSAFFVQEDSVDPRLLMRASLAAVRNKGITIHDNSEITAIRSTRGSVEVLAGGTAYIAHSAVNCMGAWAGMPVRPRKGQIFSLFPRRKNLLQHCVLASDVYLVPRSSGRIVVGATVEDIGYDRTVEPGVIENFHRAAAQLIPELRDLPVEESWVGLRPGTPDDLPLLGETDTPRVFIATGHFRNGILLAPLTAGIMADLVTGQSAAMDISAFSPGRFALSAQQTVRSS
jgi:glycine oxidase